MNKEKDSETSGAKQTDLAEGERDTVEESIRIHEQKRDEHRPSPDEGEKDAA